MKWSEKLHNVPVSQILEEGTDHSKDTLNCTFFLGISLKCIFKKINASIRFS